MRTRPKLDFWLFLCFAMLPLKAFSVQDLPDPENTKTDLIEIEYAPELMLPYRDRRPDWGSIFGFRYENFLPTGYVSPVDNRSYGVIFGKSPVAMFGLTGGVKSNLGIGALTAELSYSQGSVSAALQEADGTVFIIGLNLKKIGLHFGVWFDMIWPEPYVVPYVQADVFQINYEEADGTNQISGQSGVSLGYSAGLLIQLNWLDTDSALKALVSSGMNNAYLDFFVSQAFASGKEPHFSSGLNLGVGMKLEF